MNPIELLQRLLRLLSSTFPGVVRPLIRFIAGDEAVKAEQQMDEMERLERRRKAAAQAKNNVIPQDWLCQFGPSIGQYKGEEIPEWVEDNAGRRYFLDGTCEYDNENRRPLLGQAHGADVRVIAPGLVYRRRG